MTDGFLRGAFVETSWGWIVLGLSFLAVLREVLQHRRRTHGRRML